MGPASVSSVSPEEAGGAASGETGSTPASLRCGGGAGTAAYSSEVLVNPVPWKEGLSAAPSDGRRVIGGCRWDAVRRSEADAGAGVAFVLVLFEEEGAPPFCFPERDLLRARDPVPF